MVSSISLNQFNSSNESEPEIITKEIGPLYNSYEYFENIQALESYLRENLYEEEIFELDFDCPVCQNLTEDGPIIKSDMMLVLDTYKRVMNMDEALMIEQET